MQLALDHQETLDLRAVLNTVVNDCWLFCGYLHAVRPFSDSSLYAEIDKAIATNGVMDLNQKMTLAYRLGAFRELAIQKMPWACAARLYRGFVNLDKLGG